jgi:hypothetical protein
VIDLPTVALLEMGAIGLEGIRSAVYYAAIYGVTVLVAIWIYRDARSRGSRFAPVWALATLVFTIAAVLPYLYFRWRARSAP